MPEDMTNQSVEDMTTDDDFSFDEMFSNTDETSENETTDSNASEESFLDIRYNGADEHLTREQAIELAQKGRNYDKIYQRMQELQNDPIRKMVAEQAERAGLTLEEYTNRLAQFQETSAINRIAREFKAKNPDVSDDVATQYAQSEYRNQQNAKQQETANQRAQAEQAKADMAKQQVQVFMREYPDVDLQNLPQEVIDDIDNNGETLLSAYRHYENIQLRKELQASRTNNLNRGKAVGNIAQNVGGKKGDVDPFLAGLLGE